MEEKPPDDCAIEVNYVLGKKPFLLTRIASTGPFQNAIDFDSDGNLTITYHGKEAHRFAISFRLPEGDESGGFAGIKAWPEEGRKPEQFILPGRGVTILLPGTSLDLHAYTTTPEIDPDKVTLLSIGDAFSERGTYYYCLGMYQTNNRNEDNIVEDDPRIYNNGDPGSGERPGCLHLLFGSRRGGRR